MALSNFPNGLSSFGIPVFGSAPLNGGSVFFVDPRAYLSTTGENTVLTIQAAVTAAAATGKPATILVAPGTYAETVTIARPTGGSATLFIQGMGPNGSVVIDPAGANTNALVNHADGVSLINLTMVGTGTGAGLVNTGANFNAYGCAMEGDTTGDCAQMTRGTVAQAAAGTHGTGADCLLASCEFSLATNGVEIVCTDAGEIVRLQIQDGWFHDVSALHIYETVGSGGAASAMYGGLKLEGNTHQDSIAGTQPTDYVLLNGDNANAGIMAFCVFPTTFAGGKVLLSTALISVGNFFTGGISTGQPS